MSLTSTKIAQSVSNYATGTEPHRVALHDSWFGCSHRAHLGSAYGGSKAVVWGGNLPHRSRLPRSSLMKTAAGEETEDETDRENGRERDGHSRRIHCRTIVAPAHGLLGYAEAKRLELPLSDGDARARCALAPDELVEVEPVCSVADRVELNDEIHVDAAHLYAGLSLSCMRLQTLPIRGLLRVCSLWQLTPSSLGTRASPSSPSPRQGRPRTS